MDTITINRQELIKLMRETFIDVLTTRKDLVEEAVIGAIEDMGLGIAMEAGRTGEYIKTEAFALKLDKKISHSGGTGRSAVPSFNLLRLIQLCT
jgi:hypothetical protein